MTAAQPRADGKPDGGPSCPNTRDLATVQGREVRQGAIGTPHHIPGITPGTTEAGLELMVSHLRAALAESQLRCEAAEVQVSHHNSNGHVACIATPCGSK